MFLVYYLVKIKLEAIAQDHEENGVDIVEDVKLSFLSQEKVDNYLLIL